jgi:hypothetical protein
MGRQTCKATPWTSFEKQSCQLSEPQRAGFTWKGTMHHVLRAFPHNLQDEEVKSVPTIKCILLDMAETSYLCRIIKSPRKDSKHCFKIAFCGCVIHSNHINNVQN